MNWADLILYYLNQVSTFEPIRYVYTQEIRAFLAGYLGENSFLSDVEYIGAMKYLTGLGYIEQDTEHYRITALGRNYVVSQLSYLPPQVQPYSEDVSANPGPTAAYSGFSVFALICALVAIFGLIITTSISKSSGTSTSKLLTQTVPIPLSAALDLNGKPPVFSRLGDWFQEIPLPQDVNDSPTPLSKDSLILETETANSSNPAQIVFPLNQKGIVRIHLLISMSYGMATLPDGGQLAGQEVCILKLALSDGSAQTFKLKAGSDIREWVIGSSAALSSVGPNVKTVWKGHHKQSAKEAAIDYLVLEMPQNVRTALATSLEIQDRSQQLFHDRNPGIVLFGLALESYK